jgi:hypothetical protein
MERGTGRQMDRKKDIQADRQREVQADNWTKGNTGSKQMNG